MVCSKCNRKEVSFSSSSCQTETTITSTCGSQTPAQKQKKTIDVGVQCNFPTVDSAVQCSLQDANQPLEKELTFQDTDPDSNEEMKRLTEQIKENLITIDQQDRHRNELAVRKESMIHQIESSSAQVLKIEEQK